MTLEPDVRADGAYVVAPVGLSRRSVVRAGAGAVWAAPVVTLVTAAPAMATSGPPAPTLTIPSFDATYENNPDAFTVNPHVLVVTATLGYLGPGSTDSYAFTLTIPAYLYDGEPVATQALGFDVPQVSGSFEAGWSIVFVKSSPQIAGGAQIPFQTTITLGETGVTPYLGYRGSEFYLSGVATTADPLVQDLPALVLETPSSVLSADLGAVLDLVPSGPGLALEITAHGIVVAGEESRSGVGHLHLVVILPKIPNSCLAGPPTIDAGSLDPRWQIDTEEILDWISPGVAEGGPFWNLHFRTIEDGYSGVLGPNVGPAGFYVRTELSSTEVPPGLEFQVGLEFTADRLADGMETFCYYPSVTSQG